MIIDNGFLLEGRADMKTNSTIARLMVAGCAASLAIGAVSPAFAQSDAPPPPPPPGQGGPYQGGPPQGAPPPGQAYDANGNYYYDSCARDANSRTAAGGVIGGVAGAVAGSNLAGRHDRTGGALFGGLLGALVGSSIGHSTAACEPAPPPPPPRPVRVYRHYPYGYGYYDGPAYYAAPPPPPPPGPPPSYYDNGPPPPPQGASSDDGCQNVESMVRLPDGTQQTRLVKTCPDSNGRYQIVN
jgi:hypothetical protein